MADFPTNIHNFGTRQDQVDVVEAADVNDAYEEISAIQKALGVPDLATSQVFPTATGVADRLRQGESILDALRGYFTDGTIAQSQVRGLSSVLTSINTTFTNVIGRLTTLEAVPPAWDSIGGDGTPLPSGVVTTFVPSAVGVVVNVTHPPAGQGARVTINQRGRYLLNYSVMMTAGGNITRRQASISVFRAGQLVRSTKDETFTNQQVSLSVSDLAYLVEGDIVVPAAYQDGGLSLLQFEAGQAINHFSGALVARVNPAY